MNTTKSLEEKVTEIVQRYDGDYDLPETFAREIVNVVLDACRENLPREKAYDVDSDSEFNSHEHKVLGWNECRGAMKKKIDSLRPRGGKE